MNEDDIKKLLEETHGMHIRNLRECEPGPNGSSSCSYIFCQCDLISFSLDTVELLVKTIIENLESEGYQSAADYLKSIKSGNYHEN